MDTKSKNRLVAIVAIISIILLGLSFLTGLDLLRNSSYLQNESYFNSSSFKSIFNQYFYNVIDLNTTYSVAKNATPTDADKVKIITNQLKITVDSMTEFKYYIKYNNKVTYTNIDATDIATYVKNNALYSLKFPIAANKDISLGNINTWFENSNSTGYFIIPVGFYGNSSMNTDYKYYNSVRARLIKEIYIFAASFLVAVVALILLNKKKCFFEGLSKLYMKVPLDLRILVFIVVSAFFIFDNVKFNIFFMPINLTHFINIFIVSLFSLYIVINIKCAFIFSNNLEEKHHQIDDSICSKFIKAVKDISLVKGMFPKMLLLFISTVLLGPFVFFLLSSSSKRLLTIFISLAYIIVYIITALYYGVRRLGDLAKVIHGTEEISKGNLNYVIEEVGKGNIQKLTSNINNMKMSFKKSLEDQMKSERLKSELITNVSHDLRTPLTSIINYVDFLKDESLTVEKKQEYIAVLDRKSGRLKTIIEDLFEASKMASGSTELDLENLDFSALLHQALAEFDEKIKISSLDFKVTYPEGKIYLNLDGKKTWRVFENLLGNILKYSQPDTRVYITLENKADNVQVTMKNISSYEMDFDVNEIFERFKRGDKSRNTEGSGLGLTIAKSIVELEGGKFDIEIDGDLFKAILTFPTR